MPSPFSEVRELGGKPEGSRCCFISVLEEEGNSSYESDLCYGGMSPQTVSA